MARFLSVHQAATTCYFFCFLAELETRLFINYGCGQHLVSNSIEQYIETLVVSMCENEDIMPWEYTNYRVIIKTSPKNSP